MPNSITTGAAFGHRTRVDDATDAAPARRVDADDVASKTRRALRLAWDMSLLFYPAGVCVKCGVAWKSIGKHKGDCKVGEFEKLAREVLTGYVG